MVQKSVDTTVMAAVGAAWNSGVQACTGLRSTLESAAKQLLTPLFEQEVKIKQQISDITNTTVVPVLQDLGGRICQPLLRICTNPVTNAYVAAIRGFLQHMQKTIPDLKAGELPSQIRRVHMSVEYWWSGPMEDANKICWNLYCSDLAEIAAFFSGGFSTYSLYSRVLNALRDLQHRAIFAFETNFIEGGITDFEQNLNEVLGRLLHDSQLSLKALLNDILGGILQDPIETGIINPCLTLVKPIQDVIDSIPVPGLPDLFNLSSLTEDVLNNFVSTSIGAIIDGAFGQIERQLEATRTELNIRKVAKKSK